MPSYLLHVWLVIVISVLPVDLYLLSTAFPLSQQEFDHQTGS